MKHTTTTFCRICEALCGLEAEVDDGALIALRPDKDHVATAGFACPKGLRQQDIYASPDRLRFPEIRVGDAFRRISWDGAVAGIGARVREIREKHGPNAIAMYVGTAAGFSVLHPIFAQGFMTGLGSKSMYSSATQDCANKFAVSRAMYGFPFTLTFPDLEHIECLIVAGANPVVSKWSFLQVPNPAEKLKAIEARGGKVFFIDPRRTESAKSAGEHVAIRPDTDVFFFLSFLDELVLQGGADPERGRAHLAGVDEIVSLAARFPKERTAKITRVSPEKLSALVAAYRTARGAAIYCSTGVNMGKRGTLAFWVAEAINAISGNLDRRGGALVGKGIFDFPKFGKRTGTLLRDDRSRIGDLPSVNDAFAGGLLADEILTEGPGQVRALFVTGGNPLITMPNSARLREALGKLDLLVTIDIFKNETGSLAHYLLPATSPLERADLPFLFPLFLGLQTKPYLQATKAIVAPDGEQRDEATIYLDLCASAGAPLFGSKVAQTAMETWRAAHELRGGKGLPQEALLSLILRLSGQGGFNGLLGAPHGRLRPPHAPGSFLGQRVLTNDGRVHVAPEAFLTRAEATLEEDFEAELRDARRLKLISRRAVLTHNSWTHNLPKFVEGDLGTNHLYLHPEDAAALGLGGGDLAEVVTETATLRLPVRLLADLTPGTVALPHGWGHQHAKGLTVASRTRGVNVNLIAKDGAKALDPLSGMAHLTGIVVEVRRATGAQQPTWSGV